MVCLKRATATRGQCQRFALSGITVAISLLVAVPARAENKKSGDDLLEQMGSTPTPAPPKPDGAPSKGQKPAPAAQPATDTPTAVETVKAISGGGVSAAAAATPPAQEAKGATDAAPGDRVKAVPKKPLIKRGRLELAAFPSLSLNDAYYEHLGISGSAVFYPQDSFGIGSGGVYFYDHLHTNNVTVVRKTLTAVPAAIDLPKLFAHLDFYWVPIYGKVSVFAGEIAHFEIYATSGFGVATAFGGRYPLSGDAGLGTRVKLLDWLAVRMEVRDTFFVDRLEVNGVARSDLQNYVLFMLGASFFVPPSFEYRLR
jgi:outer membrane beta-barrel protein